MFGFPEGSIFTPGSMTKFSVNPGMCMSSCCAFYWYMVLDYLVNGGLDVLPHTVDSVEGCGEEPVTIIDECLLDPFSISLLP